MKLSKDELKTKVAEKVTDEDLQIELLEDIEDSMQEIVEDAVEKIEKSLYDELDTKYSELKTKYRDRFLGGKDADDVEDEPTPEAEPEEDEKVDIFVDDKEDE